MSQTFTGRVEIIIEGIREPPFDWCVCGGGGGGGSKPGYYFNRNAKLPFYLHIIQSVQ